MRLVSLAAAAALSLAFAGSAMAGPVVVKPLTVDAALQEKFETEYGTREITELQDALNRALTRELTARGGAISDSGPITIETTLVDARPSKPTLQQTLDRPGLDMMRSSSLGGAKLNVRFLAADGRVLNTFAYDWYETDLFTSPALTTWHDARDALRRFAVKVANAYQQQAG
jgi:Protein of unknown function (DUF3313)